MSKAHVNLTTEEMLEDCREAIKKQSAEIEALKSAIRDITADAEDNSDKYPAGSVPVTWASINKAKKLLNA